MIKYGVNNIVEFVWGDDFLCYALSGVILEVVADGKISLSEAIMMCMRYKLS
jgi:hypothetical protein